MAAPLLMVAPMMAWTDRFCRRLHRCYSPNARLYTEMVTTGALLHGPRDRLLKFAPAELPLALQLGGCDATDLAACAEIAQQSGFSEINLNVGCPSDRVQNARIGACLMAEATLVAEGCAAMQAACDIPVTVKCRLGIDDFDSDDFLFNFIDTVAAAGVTEFSVHARVAILKGLSPAQNRSVPPLNYDRVARLKARNPELTLILNGGLDSLDGVRQAIERTGCDGVMIGRAAYHNPWLLAELEHAWYGTALPANRLAPIGLYTAFVEQELALGTRLHSITRHMLGIASGMSGARAYRRYLSDMANKPDANLETLNHALGLIRMDTSPTPC